MPVEAQCPNAQCGVILTLQDDLAGKKVRCPQCGATIAVPQQAVREPAAPMQAEALEAAPAAEGIETPGAPAVHHPARQVCDLCGAVLGVRAKFCPKCGADVRTGVAVAQEAPKKKSALVPVILAVVGLGLLAAVGGGGYLIYRNWGSIAGGEEGPPVAERKDPGDEPAPAPKSRKTPPEGQTPQQQTPPPAQDYAASKEEKGLRKAVETYFLRLGETAAAREARTSEAWAKHWADLYVFCKQNGLAAEAGQCWYRAAFAAPKDRAINEQLGRTADWTGMAVTDEQKRYLGRFRARIRIVNRDAALQELVVKAPDGKLAPVPPGRTVVFDVWPGDVRLPFKFGAADSEEGSVSISVGTADIGSITFIGRHLAPAVNAEGVAYLYGGLDMWRKYGTALRNRVTASLQKMGWSRAKAGNGWDLSAGQNRPGMAFRLGEGGKLASADAGGVQLRRGSSDTFGLVRRDDAVLVYGELHVTVKGGQPWSLAGDKGHPGRLTLIGRTGQAWVRGGSFSTGGTTQCYNTTGPRKAICYVTRTEVCPELKEVWAAASAAAGDRVTRDLVAQRREELESRARDREAAGELLGGWHSRLWVEKELRPLQDSQWERLQLTRQASTLPTGVDVPAAHGIKDRQAALCLNWRRFREPLAMLGERGEGLTVAPELVALLPEANAAAETRALWRDSQREEVASEKLLRAVRALGMVNGSHVTGLLSEMARDIKNGDDLRAEAMLALGKIGTREALAVCRQEAISKRVRGASVAALAGCGDPETLGKLPETLKKAQPEVREFFLKDILAMDSPCVLLAIPTVVEAYPASEEHAAVAKRLVEMGGHAAMARLAELIEKDKNPHAAVVGNTPAHERLLLVRALGNLVNPGSDGVRDAAMLLGDSKRPEALPFLKDAALKHKLPEGVMGLAAYGSADALETAGKALDVAGAADIEALAALWRSAPDEQGRMDWKPDIDRKGAVGFLQDVLMRWKGADRRLAAAGLLTEWGEKADARALVAIAAEPVKAATARRPVAKKPTRETPSPRQRAPGPVPKRAPARPRGPRRPGPRGHAKPDTPKPKPKRPARTGVLADLAAKRTEAAKLPQMQALSLLKSNIDADVRPALMRLARSSGNAAVKAEATALLGYVADQEVIGALRGMARRGDGKLADTAAMADELCARGAAARGLAAAGDGSLIEVLEQFMREVPPAAADFAKPLASDAYDKAEATWSLIMKLCVCEAVSALAEGKTLVGAAGSARQAEGVIEGLTEMLSAATRAVGSDPDAPAVAAAAVKALSRCGALPAPQRLVIRNLIDAGPGSCPAEVRRAIMDGIAHTHDPDLGWRLSRVLPSWLEDENLKAHWLDICPQLAAAGKGGDWELLVVSLDQLPKAGRRTVFRHMTGHSGQRPAAYYALLCRLAALPMPGDEEKDEHGKPKEEPEVKKKDARRPPTKGRPRPWERPRQPGKAEEREAEKDNVEQKAQEETEEAQLQPPDHTWVDEMDFRVGCLEELARGPGAVVAAAIGDPANGLVRHEVFAPWAAMAIAERSPGFEISPWLEEWYARAETTDDARRVVAGVARRREGEDMRDVLGRLLLSGAGPLENVARALGGMGERDTLVEGLAYGKSGSALAFKHPTQVQAASLKGMAYLPGAESPTERLRRYRETFADPGMKRICEEALLGAYARQAGEDDAAP